MFVGLFYTAHVIPLFAIYSYGPTLMTQMGIGGGDYLPEVLISSLFVVGGVPGLWLVDRFGRLPVLRWTFAVMTGAFAAVVAGSALGNTVIPFVALAVFAIASGASNFIEIIVPNELFPTGVRATATGIVVAVSRIGSVVSTFLLPGALDRAGVVVIMAALALVNVAGGIGTSIFGVESKGVSLVEASGTGTAVPSPWTEEMSA